MAQEAKCQFSGSKRRNSGVKWSKLTMSILQSYYMSKGRLSATKTFREIEEIRELLP